MKNQPWLGIMAVISSAVLVAMTGALLGPNALAEQKSVDPTKDRQVYMVVGSEAIAMLPRAGGSGYFWNAKSTSSEIVGARGLGTKSKGGSPDIVGSSENDRFVLVGRQPGIAYVDFTLQRVRSTPEEKYTLTVIVK